MAIESPYLVDGDRYERSMHGWVDAPTSGTSGSPCAWPTRWPGSS